MKPYYDDGQASIYHGDARELLAGLKADVIVTDPPYGLEFMGKEWDSFRGANDWGDKGDTAPWKIRPKGGTDPFQRKTPRYHAGQPYQAWCEEWATTALDALPTGGWLLAFGGTRTWHRLACGVEDAGFEVRDTLMWLYGSGFPKGKACLKPGWEPILLARKPGSNVLQIDACRVETSDDTSRPTGNHAFGLINDDGWQARSEVRGHAGGRWPANVVLDEVAADLLDQQSGTLHSQDPVTRMHGQKSPIKGATPFSTGREPIAYDDKGGASRFFYTAKAGRSERVKVDGEQHPTVKPLALMRWLVRLVTPPGGTVLDPFCGSGSTLVAARMEGFRAIGIEADERWCEGSAMRLREHEQGQGVLDLSG